MKGMVISLYDPRCLEDVMLALTANDVRDAVVLDATAVGSALMQNMPLFAGFRADLGEPRSATKVVFALVPDEAAARAVRDELKEAGIDLDDPATAKVVLLPAEALGG
jgi:hypothetical protein